MWVRGVLGLVLVVVGGVWIAQGSGAMHGSAMSGHSQYAALGVVVLLLGVGLIAWAFRIKEGRRPRS